MPSTNGHYDQSLLAAAPAATKSQLQEGYNPDLLVQSNTAPKQDLENAYVSKENLTGEPSPPPRPVPFWRTTKGIIIIAVGAIVIIGAVVGGAVGGTRNKKNNVNTAETQGVQGSSGSPSSSSSPPASSSDGAAGALSILAGPSAAAPSPSPSSNSQQSGSSTSNGVGSNNGNNTPPPPPNGGNADGTFVSENSLNDIGSSVPGSRVVGVQMG